MILALLLLLCLALPAHAARQFTGNPDCLQSASSLTLSSPTLLNIQMWLWWDTYADNDLVLAEYSPNYSSTDGTFFISPNYSSPSGWGAIIHTTGGANYSGETILRSTTSAGAWHHIVITMDIAGAAGDQVTAIYTDGVSRALSNANANAVTYAFSDSVLYLMARNCGGLWASGRLAEVALWTGTTLTQGNVDSLYNSGSGALATSVASGNLVYYWKLCGDTSPEPATTGGVNMTVAGTTQVAHPISTCTAASTRRKAVVIE